MKFKARYGSEVVEATRWLKNGDHPDDFVGTKIVEDGDLCHSYSQGWRRGHDFEGDVVRRFRHPNTPGQNHCLGCGEPFHKHGWLEKENKKVCPGDWVVTTADGTRAALCPSMMRDVYEEVIEPPPPKQPAFEIHNSITGHVYRIFTNGEISGFPLDSTLIINRIPTLLVDAHVNGMKRAAYEEVKEPPSEKPAFEIRDVDSTACTRIYADGRVEGIGGVSVSNNFIIVNRIPMLIAEACAKVHAQYAEQLKAPMK